MIFKDTPSLKGVAIIIVGKTSVIQHKGVATRLARSAGATVVHNNIEVSDEAKAKAAAHLANNTGGSGGLAKASVLPAK